MLARSAAIAAPLVVLAACGGGGDAKAVAKDASVVVLADAAPSAMQIVPVPVPMVGDEPDAPAPHGGGKGHPRVLALTLESTPNHATVTIDDVEVGTTPTYWEGEFTGRARVFTFRLTGYTPSVYRFVPTHDGFVHARLLQGSDDNPIPVPIPVPVPVPVPLPTATTKPPPTPRPDAAPAPAPLDAAPPASPNAALEPPPDAAR